MDFLNLVILNNSIQTWLLALLAVVATAITLRLVKRLGVRYLQQWSTRTKTSIDDVMMMALEKSNPWIMNLLAIYAGVLVLQLDLMITEWSTAFAFVLCLMQVGIWADVAVNYWLVEKPQEGGSGGRMTTLNAVAFVARLAIFSVLFLVGLDNLPGVDVTALLTGLGIGGVAVALAVQNILGDLFASLSIALDKPFVIGDFIELDNYRGTVEYVGLKTTRIRSASGEQIVVSNSDLLSSRVRNYQRMDERRVVFNFGITYDATVEQLRAIPAMVTDIIESIDNTRLDRIHFSALGDFSLNFELVYYVLSPEYELHMDIQQEINLALLEAFTEEGLEFAYPTQVLYVANAEEDGDGPTESKAANLLTGNDYNNN
ncbi:MAG TPA: mechanosensitive ion channel family protein [Anaerolineae bacterium]|nr:mechanosensitive ion channel family protein [Anaerolineae bacterium]